jgi:hypothetical protein
MQSRQGAFPARRAVALCFCSLRLFPPILSGGSLSFKRHLGSTTIRVIWGGHFVVDQFVTCGCGFALRQGKYARAVAPLTIVGQEKLDKSTRKNVLVQFLKRGM